MLVIRQFSKMLNDDYKTYLIEFGKNLRRIRKGLGLTMEAVANDAEIEYRQLARIERGEINTSIISLLRIAKVMKIDIQQLFIFPIDILENK